MKYVYFDASALVKQYTLERGSDIVNTIFECVSISQVVCSILNIGETTSILVRKRNNARIPDLLFKQSFAHFNAEIVNNQDVHKTAVDNVLVNSSLAFILIHNINATDAIILRLALDLQHALREAGDTLLSAPPTGDCSALRRAKGCLCLILRKRQSQRCNGCSTTRLHLDEENLCYRKRGASDSSIPRLSRL